MRILYLFSFLIFLASCTQRNTGQKTVSVDNVVFKAEKDKGVIILFLKNSNNMLSGQSFHEDDSNFKSLFVRGKIEETNQIEFEEFIKTEQREEQRGYFIGEVFTSAEGEPILKVISKETIFATKTDSLTFTQIAKGEYMFEIAKNQKKQEISPNSVVEVSDIS